jgi:putative Holliday junction resolvase
MTGGGERGGRLLGLDVGDRRIGVAVSDPEQHLAVPLRTLVQDGRGGDLDALERLVRDEEIVGIVVGLPLSLSGESGAQANSARAYAKRLQSRLGVDVYLYDERLSTQQALRMTAEDNRGGRRRGRSSGADTDALAASIILQAFIDSRRFDSAREGA